MKIISSVLLLMLVTLNIAAQKTEHNPYPPLGGLDPSVENTVYRKVEVIPEFEGGEAALMKFIENNMVYPKDAYKMQIQGRVIAGFIINEKGGIDSITIKHKVWPSIDAELLQILALTAGHWKAGLEGGKPVRVQYVLPVSVKLSGSILLPVVNLHATSIEKKAINAYNAQSYVKAQKIFQIVCDADPGNNFALHNLGVCMYQNGDKEAACSQWQKLRDIDIHTADLLLDTYCKSIR